jgi:hypothetical protein
VLAEVAAAVPREVHPNIIIIGSLAAGYWLFPRHGSFGVRTKDVDCVLSPQLSAVEKGRAVAETLLAAGWRARTEGDFGKPGNEHTPVDQLPAVRLYPPPSPSNRSRRSARHDLRGGGILSKPQHLKGPSRNLRGFCSVEEALGHHASCAHARGLHRSSKLIHLCSLKLIHTRITSLARANRGRCFCIAPILAPMQAKAAPVKGRRRRRA